MHMKDEFESFDELSASMREGDDYKIAFDDRDSEVSIVAPHGGKIEPGTPYISARSSGLCSGALHIFFNI